jgi:hypothetical protein
LPAAAYRAKAGSAGSSSKTASLLDIAAVFAGLLTAIIIGRFVENPIFRAIGRNTVQKWGTQT